MMSGWYDQKLTPMKIGTVPAVVKVHASDLKSAAPGKWIRIKESEGDKWHSVLVTKVDPDGHIFADR